MADSMLPLVAAHYPPHCSRHPLPVPAISSPADQSPNPDRHGAQVRIVVVTLLDAQQLGKGGIVGGGLDGVLLPPHQGRHCSRQQGSHRPCWASSAASSPPWHDRLPPQPPGTTLVANLLPPPPPLPPSKARSNRHALQTTIEFNPSNGDSTRKEPRLYVSPPNTYTLDRCPTLPGGDADVELSVVVRIDGGGPVDPVPGPMRHQIHPGLCHLSSLGGQGGSKLGGGLMVNARRRGGFVPPSFL
jgi:hypothetical protein